MDRMMLLKILLMRHLSYRVFTAAKPDFRAGCLMGQSSVGYKRPRCRVRPAIHEILVDIRGGIDRIGWSEYRANTGRDSLA